MNIKINKKDDIIIKILHYFITEEDYKPVIVNGIQNEIWLENMQKDLKLIRINTNYIHNQEQLNNDTYKALSIMKTIKKNTLSFNMTMLNLLLDTGDIKINDDIKNVETIRVNKLNDFRKNKFINEFFPKVKDAEFSDKADPLEFFKLSEDMNEKTIKNEKKLAKIFRPKKPHGTYIIICICLVMFLFQYTLNIDMIRLLGNNYELVKGGEIYRLITCMFLHGSIMHLICNMYALYVLGSQVERYYGTLKFLVIYFISGILGSLFSCVFMNSYTYSIGASGAIFGLLGSIAYFTYNYRATLQSLLRGQVMPAIIVNLLMGLIVPGIDVTAHVGGLIGGILVSMGIGLGDKYRKSDQINGFVVLLLMFIAMIYFIIVK